MHPASCSLRSDLGYTALPYMWSDPSVTRAIFVSGQELQVTIELADALYQLCVQVDAARSLWTDASCTNQRDNIDKSHQVQKIESIYRKATAVTAWLCHSDCTGAFVTQASKAASQVAQSLCFKIISSQTTEPWPSNREPSSQ